MKDHINRLLKTSEKKTKYIVQSGQKYKDDVIYCFVSENHKWGVMKMNDLQVYEELLPPIYNSTGYETSRDLIVAVNYRDEKYTLGKNSYILFSTDGLQVASVENIDYLIFDKKGSILVVKNGKYGALDEMFQFVVSCEYNLLTSLSNDIFAFEKDLSGHDLIDEEFKNGSGIINLKNEIIASFNFIFRVFPHIYFNTVIVGTDDDFLIEKEYFAFNLETKEKNDLPFEKIYDTQTYNYHYKSQPFYRTVIDIGSEFVNFKIDTFDTAYYEIGKWGVVFPSGQIAIPNEYDYIERISAKYFKFCIGIPLIEEDAHSSLSYLKNTKWGIIDINNKVVIDAEYDWISIYDGDSKIIGNKGGTVFWNELEHKPEWEVDGGVFEEFKL